MKTQALVFAASLVMAVSGAMPLSGIAGEKAPAACCEQKAACCEKNEPCCAPSAKQHKAAQATDNKKAGDCCAPGAPCCQSGGSCCG